MLNGEGSKFAIIANNIQITYAALTEYIAAYSSYIDDVSGKHIAIYSENRPEWIYSFYACWNTNNIPVPIDFASGVDEIAFILNDCRPEVIFCSTEKLEHFIKALAGVKYEPRLLIIDELNTSNIEKTKVDISYQPNDTAVIIYTSGTTGSPKGVMLSFDNILVNIDAVSEKVKILNGQDTILMLLPMHHILPLLGTMIIPMYLGGTIAVSPSLNADDIIKTLQANKVSILIGVPRLFSLIRKGIVDKINQKAIARLFFKMAKVLKSEKFSKKIFKEVHQKFGGHIRFMVAGGAALDPEVATDFNSLGFDILEGYGMTEAAPMISFTQPKSFVAGSAGHIVPGIEAEIRNGEVVTKGRHVMQGYYNRPKETAEVVKDGWLHTGDLGRIDKDRRLYITGRKKEIIVLSNGKNINPAEMETKLEKSTELISEAGVFVHNDVLSVVLVPEPRTCMERNVKTDSKTFKKTVVEPFNNSVATSKAILKVYVSDEELPKTRLGKIQRFKLPEFAQRTIINTQREPAPKVDYKEYNTIADFVKEQTGLSPLPTDSLDGDLALDSLSRITLLVYIENTFGVKIKEEHLNNFESLLQLTDHVRETKTRFKLEAIDWNKILKEKVHFTLPKAGLTFNIFNWLQRGLMTLIFRIKSRGMVNIPDGPCIIAPNHQSFLDGFMLTKVLNRKTMRRTYFYAKEKHWRKSWQKFIARKNNVILMDINKDLKLSLQKMAAVLAKGKNIIIFPEGTRSSDGTLGQFKKTFAILAQELNVPVVPVAINGSHKVMPAGAKFPKLFRKITVDFLKPVYPSDTGYDSLRDKIKTNIQKKVKN